MIETMLAGAPRRALVALALLLSALVAAPLFVNAYALSVLILALYYAYTGQAWNMMIGFAGLLSLGEAMFVGLGAYASAGLFQKFGVPPVLGLFLSVAVSAAAGAAVGWLAFRFDINGVYFALLTIAFSEFTRILVDNWAYLGGSEGLFLHVSGLAGWDIVNLRGSPVMFYYVLLAMTSGMFLLCRYLLASRLGYYWRAIREDQDAARSLGVDVFACKMAAVTISSGAAGLAGVVYAFYYNNLFPETAFALSHSIDMLLGAVVGGVGTLFGPIFGALLLTPLGEALTAATDGLRVPGVKQFFWGVVVAAIVLARPTGLWPMIAGALGLDKAGLDKVDADEKSGR